MHSPASTRDIWIRRFIAVAAFASGCSVILNSFTRWQSPGRPLSLLLGLALLYLAQQLLNRKRIAWRLALGSAAVLIVLDVWWGRLTLATVFLGITMVALYLSRGHYTARSEVLSIRQGIYTFCFSLILALAYGTFGFWLMDKRDFGIEFNLRDSFTQTLREYTQLGNSNLSPHTRHADWFLDSLGLLGAATALYGLYSLFRPVAYEFGALPAERQRMTELISRYSNDTEDYFKIWPHDKSYFFNSAGTGGLAYKVESGVAMSLGGPAGPPLAAADSLREFQAFCLEQGWIDSYLLYLDEADRQLYEGSGCKFFKIGEDAAISLEKFTSSTSKNKHFRNVRNRFEKAGFVTEISRPPHSQETLKQLAAVSTEWLRQPGRREWRFFAGYYSAEYMAQCPVFLLKTPAGRIEAFVNLVPVYKPGWATIDLLRYRESALPNTMDYLLMRLMHELNAQGIRYFNLGLAPMAGLMEGQPGPHERLLHLMYQSNQKLVSVQGLRKFKAKFDPDWAPKYMAYRGGLNDLPRLGYALSRLIRNDTR